MAHGYAVQHITHSMAVAPTVLHQNPHIHTTIPMLNIPPWWVSRHTAEDLHQVLPHSTCTLSEYGSLPSGMVYFAFFQ